MLYVTQQPGFTVKVILVKGHEVMSTAEGDLAVLQTILFVVISLDTE